MTTLTVLVTALLFGGMTLYSFGFAAFLFTALPPETARPVIRKAFPHFYLFVLGCAVLAGVPAIWVDGLSAWIMAGIAASTVYARQVLMGQINAATDAGDKSRFKALHGLSVAITLAHIGLAAWVLVRVAV